MAVGWAAFLYKGSIDDKRVAQARLLSVVGGAVPVQALPGERMKSESVATDVRVSLVTGGSEATVFPALAEEAYWARIYLVSTSEEAFSDVSVALLLDDGTVVNFPLGQTEMAPRAEWERYAYFHPGRIKGSMRVRVRFRDAAGRSWERTNGEPVRESS